jgi:hypothetical protein
MLKKIFFEMMVGGSWSSIREIELKWWPDRCIKRFCFAVCWLRRRHRGLRSQLSTGGRAKLFGAN